MDEKKVGNKAQICFAQDIVIADKRCILVQNGELELLFNKDNALDIVGIEPALTRFDNFKTKALKAKENKTYTITIHFQ